MKRITIKTGRLACLVIALAYLWGCGEQPDTARKPKVVRRKITTTAKAPKPARKAPSTLVAGKSSSPRPISDLARAKPPKKKSAVKSGAAGTAATAQRGLRPKSDIARQPVPSKPSRVAAQKPGSQPPAAGVAKSPPAAGSAKKMPPAEPAPPAGKPQAVAIAEKADSKTKPAADKKGLPPVYNPEGKTDPFKPLFAEKPPLPKKRSRKKRIPRTPLERVALSQLRLTAIIMAPSGNRALVQESSGKGYVIQNGTYIGLNAGKVVEIQKDRVIIEEEVESVIGKPSIRKQELKLPKPAGES